MPRVGHDWYCTLRSQHRILPSTMRTGEAIRRSWTHHATDPTECRYVAHRPHNRPHIPKKREYLLISKSMKFVIFSRCSPPSSCTVLPTKLESPSKVIPPEEADTAPAGTKHRKGNVDLPECMDGWSPEQRCLHYRRICVSYLKNSWQFATE